MIRLSLLLGIFGLRLMAGLVAPTTTRAGDLAKPKKPRAALGKWGRFFHIAAYYINDSRQGVIEAYRKGYRAIDLNFHVTRDGVIVNTHWATPLQHGFIWDTKATAAMRALPKNTAIKDMTWEQVKHLVAKGEYRIKTFAYMANLCARLGMRMEFETKNSPGFLRPAIWEKVAEVQKRRHLDMQVKAESWVGVKGRALAIFHAVKAVTDLTTILLPRGARRVRRKAAYGVVDYVRGPIIWVGKAPQ